jgi:hypothetical protein
MPRMGFEPTTPVFERAKMVHALDRAAGHCDPQLQIKIGKLIRANGQNSLYCNAWSLFRG